MTNRLILTLTGLLMNFILITAAADIRITGMKCENLVNPVAIDNNTPYFSWKIQGNDITRQQYYQIQVATDSIQLTYGKADLWNPGKIESAASVMLSYGGKELQSRDLCYWRVRVWNENGKPSAWSEIQRFGIGISENDKLGGEYIGLAPGNGDVRAPLLRKTFTISQTGTTFVHVSSLGYHELYINGIKADARVLAPATSQLSKRSLTVTYDITPYINEGENEMVFWLGQGWYKKTTFGTDYDGPLVKAETDVLTGGRWNTILVTDNSWTGRESGYTDTNTWQALRFGGERIDARLIPRDLLSVTLNKLTWFPVTTVPLPHQKESPQMCNPNKIQEVLIPQNIRPAGENTWIIDFGKVITGWFSLQTPRLAEGNEIITIYTDDIHFDPDFKDQGESDIYIASGREGDVFCNKFNHHAFRYVKISNLPVKPEINDMKGYLIHGDYQQASTFECSDSDLNVIHNMVQYTMECLTFSGYMVDCPHIERAGYGGDGNSSTQTLQTMYDVSPTFLNWLQSWHDAIKPDGGLPHTAPNYGTAGGGPYWCGFMVMAPWRTYLNYADSRLIDRYYDTMKHWLGYVDKYTVDGLLKRWPDTNYRDWYLGDWLAPAGVDPGNQASIDLVNNCFISQCLDALQKMALILDKPDDARVFSERRTTLNSLIHRTFYCPENDVYGTGSQLDMCYPMSVGVVPEPLYNKVKEKMIELTATQYNGHIAVGLVGVPVLTDWAIRNNAADFMYSLLKQSDYPGYLYMLNNGATTTWEYWSGERSRVHNCYNGIGNWFYEAVGGIRTDENYPGYERVRIHPQIFEGVSWAKTTKETPYGTIVVNWERKNGVQNMYISLPVGVQATVTVPGREDVILHAGNHTLQGTYDKLSN
jgi:alpha-L-rhamnosidase